MAEKMADMGLITEMLSKLGPSASMADVLKLIAKNPSEVGPLTDQLKGLQKPAPNLDTFDYAALTPGKKVIQLGHLGNNGPDHQPGMKPVFMVYCYDDNGSRRITQELTDSPNAKLMLDILKRAIAAPLPPLKPALPWQLCVSLKLKPQFSSPDIKKFLNGLPKPFHWRFETAEERDNLADGIEENTTKATLAILHANRAAAYLLPGEHESAQKALEDGDMAERYDPCYEKSYIRQAVAHEKVVDNGKAKMCLERGLRVPALQNNKGLIEQVKKVGN